MKGSARRRTEPVTPELSAARRRAALKMHRLYDGRQTTRAARASFQQGFVDEAIKMLGPNADGRAIARQAAINRKAYYAEFSAVGVGANKRAAASRRAERFPQRTKQAA